MPKRQSNGAGTYVAQKDGTIEYRISVGIGMDGKLEKRAFTGKQKRLPEKNTTHGKRTLGMFQLKRRPL